MSNGLVWNRIEHGILCATIGKPKDNVIFLLSHLPSNYRRGPFKLLIEVCGGENHHKWGCFDDQDQPVRYYHCEENAKSEAQKIADVFLADRRKHDERRVM